MPSTGQEKLDHETRHNVEPQDDRAEARADAMDALWDNHNSLSREQLDLVIFGERKGGEDDRSRTQWQTIQDGLAQDKMDDLSLSAFAEATGDYVRETSREALQSDIARSYTGQDHILADKIDSIDANMTAHALQTISERSGSYPFPEADAGHFDRHVELARMAQQGNWADIPRRIRDINQELSRETPE